MVLDQPHSQRVSMQRISKFIYEAHEKINLVQVTTFLICPIKPSKGANRLQQRRNWKWNVEFLASEDGISDLQ